MYVCTGRRIISKIGGALCLWQGDDESEALDGKSRLPGVLRILFEVLTTDEPSFPPWCCCREIPL